MSFIPDDDSIIKEYRSGLSLDQVVETCGVNKAYVEDLLRKRLRTPVEVKIHEETREILDRCEEDECASCEMHEERLSCSAWRGGIKEHLERPLEYFTSSMTAIGAIAIAALEANRRRDSRESSTQPRQEETYKSLPF